MFSLFTAPKNKIYPAVLAWDYDRNQFILRRRYASRSQIAFYKLYCTDHVGYDTQKLRLQRLVLL